MNMLKPIALVLTLPLALVASRAMLAADIELPQTNEAPAVRKLVDRFSAVDDVAHDREGRLVRITLRGLPEIEGAVCRIVFAPETEHVVEVSGNRAAFANDEWSLLVPLKQLQKINLHHNFGPSLKRDREDFDGGGLTVLKDNKLLETVNLPGSPFGGDGLKAIAELPQVKHLGIWHVRVSDEDFAVLRGHPSLESIRVAPMWSPKITDKAIEHLSYCPNLKQVKLNESYVTWENGLRHLTKLKGTLKELNLEESVIAPEDLEQFREAMPAVAVNHAGMAEVGALIRDNFKGAGGKLPKWVPQELLDRYVAAAGPASGAE